MKKMRFTIIIPTYKEERVIAGSIKKLNKLYPKSEIIVVDDSPNEKTKKVVEGFLKKNVKYIRNKKENIGLSGSVLYGIKKAKNDIVVVIDADLQHPVEKIEKIVELLRKGDVEIVIAERIGNLNTNLFRWISSGFAISLGNLSLRIRGKRSVKDPTTGFFGVKKEILEKIDERRVIKKGWKIAFDILKQIDDSKVRSVFYIKLKERKKGESKYGIKPILYYLLSLIT